MSLCVLQKILNKTLRLPEIVSSNTAANTVLDWKLKRPLETLLQDTVMCGCVIVQKCDLHVRCCVSVGGSFMNQKQPVSHNNHICSAFSVDAINKGHLFCKP